MILDKFVQWLVANTLFPETINHHNQKDGFKETRELGLYWKSRPVTCMVNMELKSESDLWVKTILSHGTNKYVVDSNYNNTEVPADPHEEQASQSSVKVIAARSKAKAKPQKRETAELQSTIPMNERKWIGIEPSEPSVAAYEVSKKVISLLRRSQTVQREEDGAIPFWRISFIFEINSHNFLIGQMSVGKFAWQQEEVQKEDISIALIMQEQFFTSVLFKDTPDVISLILCYRTM